MGDWKYSPAGIRSELPVVTPLNDSTGRCPEHSEGRGLCNRSRKGNYPRSRRHDSEMPCSVRNAQLATWPINAWTCATLHSRNAVRS